MNYYINQTKFGAITISEEHGLITKICFGVHRQSGNLQCTDIIEQAFIQLEEYFNGERKTFSLALNPKGTSFQQKIWSILYTIPYGETRTYKEIAYLAGNENSSRAVGSANNKNPIAIVIPCHRVIGSNSNLTGYAGGLEIKQRLLELESSY